MKFPLTQQPGAEGIVRDADGEIVPLHLLSTLTELVRRANAFDELLEFVEATLNSYPSGARAHQAAALLAKYDVPSTEDKE